MGSNFLDFWHFLATPELHCSHLDKTKDQGTGEIWSLDALTAWIIERLDRKLADAIGSKIVEKCDLTLSRAIQPLTSDVLRVLLLIAYFISLSSTIQIAHVLDLLSEKTVRGYKTGRGKRQNKWLWNLWERRMTPAPDNFMHQTGSLTR